MAYCSPSEVKAAINFPSTGAPITDEQIASFVVYSEEEIEDVYKTKFGSIEQNGTADGDYSTTTLSLTTLEMDVDDYIGYVLWIHAGTNSGEYRQISANTATKITVDTAFSAATDVTSQFRIVKLGYKSQTVDGTGTDTMFVQYQPLISLNSLTIDDTSVTPAYVYQYNDSGKLVLGTSDAEVKYFSDTYPQLIDLEYIYGVYPLPKVIKRLCICLAGIRTLTSQIAGTYDDFTNVSLPGGLTASKGEPYTNIREAVATLQGEARGIIFGSTTEGQIGGGVRINPSYRPFTLFA